MKGRSKGSSNMIQKGVMASDAAPTDVYTGANSEVVKAARAKKKRGGGLKHVAMEGHKGMKRGDRPARKDGGRATGTGKLAIAQWDAAQTSKG